MGDDDGEQRVDRSEDQIDLAQGENESDRVVDDRRFDEGADDDEEKRRVEKERLVEEERSVSCCEGVTEVGILNLVDEQFVGTGLMKST